MAAFLYDKGREAFLKWRHQLGPRHDQSHHGGPGHITRPTPQRTRYLGDVPGSARALPHAGDAGQQRPWPAGVADAGLQRERHHRRADAGDVLIFQDNGSDATSRLIALIDTATGLPVAPGATRYDISRSNGATKIFKL